MPPATSESSGSDAGYPTDAAYPSRNIAFQAAGMITSIIEHLRVSDELKYTPAFMYDPCWLMEAATDRMPEFIAYFLP